MSQHYSDPKRAREPFALPDVETFFMTDDDIREWKSENGDDDMYTESGWYVWFCMPGCMPDSDPYGPYPTEREALAVAREVSADLCDDDDNIEGEN